MTIKFHLSLSVQIKSNLSPQLTWSHLQIRDAPPKSYVKFLQKQRPEGYYRLMSSINLQIKTWFKCFFLLFFFFPVCHATSTKIWFRTWSSLIGKRWVFFNPASQSCWVSSQLWDWFTPGTTANKQLVWHKPSSSLGAGNHWYGVNAICFCLQCVWRWHLTA